MRHSSSSVFCIKKCRQEANSEANSDKQARKQMCVCRCKKCKVGIVGNSCSTML